MNKKMNGNLIVVCLLFSLLTGTNREVQASADIDAENVKTVIVPRNTNMKYSTISLSDTAKCSASVTGYSSNTSHVSIYLYLQKYTGSGWSNAESWSDPANDYTLSMYETTLTSSGRYRLKASDYAENENIIKYSSEKVY
nr:hypothetical protein [uncultured Blautia sp.]